MLFLLFHPINLVTPQVLHASSFMGVLIVLQLWQPVVGNYHYLFIFYLYDFTIYFSLVAALKSILH